METIHEEIKFQIIEELYFVTNFFDLISNLDWDDDYEEMLIGLLQNDEIKQLEYNHTDFDQVKNLDLDNLAKYWYLASKKGLLNQNGLM